MRNNACSAWVRQVCDATLGLLLRGAVQSMRRSRRKEGTARGYAAPWSSWLKDVSVLLFFVCLLWGSLCVPCAVLVRDLT